MRNQILSTLAVAGGCLWLSSCDSQKVTGTMDETNAGAARLVDSTGRPASGANLLVYVPSDTTGKVVTSGVTLGDGSYSLPSVQDGMYRIVARSSGSVAVLDSVYTNQGKLLVRTDTLRQPGSLTGTVKMVGDDNPAAVEVSVLGSDLSVANVSRDGSFRLDDLGTGTWKLKFSTPLSGYSATYATVRTRAGVVVRMDTVTLSYYGIPPVTGLQGTYDSAKNRIRLTWSVPAGVPGVRTVQVFRTDMASSAAPQQVGMSENGVFVDSSLYAMYNGVPLRWLYNLQIQTLDGSVGRVAYVVVTTTGNANWRIIDSLGTLDSLRRIDSIRTVDSLLRKDSTKQTTSPQDSLRRLDSLRVVDSLLRAQQITQPPASQDSLRRLDSIRIADSLARANPTPLQRQIDSMATVLRMDSLVVDSLRRTGIADSMGAKVQYDVDRIRYDSLVSVRTSGVVGTSETSMFALVPRRDWLDLRDEKLLATRREDPETA
jgi:hypothetical protein